MKISELVQKLEDVRREHGDLRVFHYNDWDYFEVDDVWPREEGKFERFVYLEGGNIRDTHLEDEEEK